MASEGWVRLHPLSPLASSGRLLLAALLIGVQSLGEVVADFATSGGRGVGGIALVILGIAAAIFVYSHLAWRMSGYRVTSTRIELRKGIVFRQHRSLPLARMESVDVVQPIIPRLFGLADVRVEAVSEGESELRLRYLGLADAEGLRDELGAIRRGEAAEAPTVTPLARVNMNELVAAYFIPPAIGALPFAVVPLVLAVLGEASILAVLLAVPVFFLGAVPVFMTSERFWDFRVEDAGDALVIKRGVLNLTTQRIATGRIQAVRVDQPLFWRPFHRFRLVVDVAGYRGADRKDNSSATLMPIAPLGVIVDLLRRIEIRTDLDALEYEGLPARARWRSPLRWRFYRVAWTETHAVSRYGRFWRRTAVVPHAKLQSVRLTQGPWQRRLDLCTVHLDTAGGRVRARARHRDVSEAVAVVSGKTVWKWHHFV